MRTFSGLIATACVLLFTAARAAAAGEAPASHDMAQLSPAQQQLQAEALSAFRSQRYAAAFGRFAKLANEGHVPSARMALLMLEQGLPLFGGEWSASVPEQMRWRALVINSARDQSGAIDTLRGE